MENRIYLDERGYLLNDECIRKRGCYLCTEPTRFYLSQATKAIRKFVGRGDKGSYICPHSECPYHELDQYERYRDYDLEVQRSWNRMGSLLGTYLSTRRES